MHFSSKFTQSPFSAAGILNTVQTFLDHLRGNLPHASLLAGVVGLAWRAVLVAEPAGPLVFVSTPIAAPPPPGEQLVVISANLYHDFPRYRDMAERLEAFALLVEEQGADILLLQEVARTPELDVSAWLRARLGMAYAYARANGHAEGIGFEEGVAIFSRFPLASAEVRQLSGSGNPFSRRIGLRVTVLLPGGILEAISVHLGLAAGANTRQVEALENWVTEIGTGHAIVIGGDFNAEAGTERIRELRSHWRDVYLAIPTTRPAATHTLSAPWGTVLREHRLDYIFLAEGTADWLVLDTRHMETEGIRHSDHRVVVTEIGTGQP